MHVTIDPRRCQSTGFCERVAPALFRTQVTGATLVLDPTPPSDLHEVAREAEALCPTAAIRVDQTRAS
jgi:ferredoxin